MKCPKYIEESLRKRARFAELFNVHDSTISHFVLENDIDAEDYDILGGCESIVNPYDSQQRVYKAILAKEAQK